MSGLGDLRLLRLVMAVLLSCASLPPTVCAQPGTAAPAADSAQVARNAAERTVAESRELLKSGDYDRAIEVLKAALAGGPYPEPLMQDLYLQLIKTYVTLGNVLKFRPQGREQSNLNYRAAHEQIVECLSNAALRHTRPEPATDYPPEMARLFTDVRAERFGAFRVVGVEPAEATVLLDGDPLQLLAAGVRGGDDVPVGTHSVVVGAPGYRTLVETAAISPGATLERSYVLSRRHGARWYVTRGALVVGAGVGVGLVVGRGRTQSPSAGETLLPPAPPPP
jgi:hypothetical protein